MENFHALWKFKDRVFVIFFIYSEYLYTPYVFILKESGFTDV